MEIFFQQKISLSKYNFWAFFLPLAYALLANIMCTTNDRLRLRVCVLVVYALRMYSTRRMCTQ